LNRTSICKRNKGASFSSTLIIILICSLILEMSIMILWKKKIMDIKKKWRRSFQWMQIGYKH